jgi:hypothetical protein
MYSSRHSANGRSMKKKCSGTSSRLQRSESSTKRLRAWREPFEQRRMYSYSYPPVVVVEPRDLRLQQLEQLRDNRSLIYRRHLMVTTGRATDDDITAPPPSTNTTSIHHENMSGADDEQKHKAPNNDDDDDDDKDNDENEEKSSEVDLKDIESVALAAGVGRKLRSRLMKYENNYNEQKDPVPIAPPSSDPFGIVSSSTFSIFIPRAWFLWL